MTDLRTIVRRDVARILQGLATRHRELARIDLQVWACHRAQVHARASGVLHELAEEVRRG